MYMNLVFSPTCPTFISFLIPSGRTTLSKTCHQVLYIHIRWSIPGRPSSLHMSIMTHVEKSLTEHFSSVQLLNCVQLFMTPMDFSLPGCPVHYQPPVSSNSCPPSWWCNPTISSSASHFSSFLQSFPAAGYFPMSQFFISGGQNIGASTSASVLPMNIQDWFPLGWTGLISLQFKELPSVFSSTIVQKHHFFVAQPTLWSNLTSTHDY